MKILRARVIEGSLPIPEALRVQTPGMTENNYELICPYNNSTWRQLQFGVSLSVYESYRNKKPSLDDQVKAAGAKAPKANPEPVLPGPER